MGPAVSLIENPNGFAYMMCVMIPLFLYFYQQSKYKRIRWPALLLALASVFIVFRTGSRTGLLILIALCLFLLPKYGKHHPLALMVGALVIFLFLPLVGGLNVQRYKTIPAQLLSVIGIETKTASDSGDAAIDSQSDQSADERKRKNRDTWKLIQEHPLFGAGVNPDERLYAGQFPMATGQVHCEILMAGRQMGLLGMLLYMSLLTVLLVQGYRIQRCTSKSWPEMSDLGWTLKMQMLAFVVGGAFSPLPWNSPEMILVGVASALWGAVKGTDGEPSLEEPISLG